MTTHAVTVLGHDRPGIIAEVTAILASLGGNLEDSSMTLLRGHFAMTLIVSADAPAEEVEQALSPIAQDGSLLVSVRSVPDEQGLAEDGPAYVLTVHGADRPGIVSAITRVVADEGGNIVDLSTRLAGRLYVVAAEVVLPPSVDVPALRARLSAVAGELGVAATLGQAEADVL